MLGTTTKEVTLIDFEYGGANYRGFDLANHWNEWAGKPAPDYTTDTNTGTEPDPGPNSGPN